MPKYGHGVNPGHNDLSISVNCDDVHAILEMCIEKGGNAVCYLSRGGAK